MAKLAGLGAVIGRDGRGLARRWYWYAARAVFVAGLLAALGLAAWAGQREGATVGALARAGQRLFSAFSATQLALVLLAAPAAMAGSICREKECGTLAYLLATDLSATELILGKLAAQVVPLLGLVACGIPVMELATLFGGVNPDALIGAALIAAGAGVFGCALTLLLSVWGTRTHEVLLVTYAVYAVWIGIGPGWMLYNRIGVLLYGPPAWLLQSNPLVLVVGLALGPLRTGWPGVTRFLAGSLLAAAVLTQVAIVAFRPVALRQLERPMRSASARAGWRWWPGPSLDRNPVLWREWRRGSRTGWTRIIWGLYAVLALGTTGTMITLVARWGLGVGTEVASLLNGMQVAAGMLLVAVAATTALAGERAQGDWDVLLTTPLESRTIVVGKWWSAFRGVPWLAVPAGLTTLAVATRSGRYAGVALVMGLVLAYGAALASLGLALALWFPRGSQAATLGVAAHVLVTVGWVVLIGMLTQGARGFRGPGLASASPFLAVMFTTIVIQQKDPPEWSECIGWISFWIIVELATAVVLLVATLATFDRAMGRQSGRGRR
jgi:ABC-type transport system involved in multi-copper enzyme maturation permease subunit